MKNHTTFKVGGIVRIMVFPTQIKTFVEVIKYVNNSNLKYYILGNCSNIIIPDEGLSGVVIRTEKLNNIEINGDNIIAQMGALLSTISNKALKSQLTGFEFASGIPGTLGGAIVMNAGAYGGEMKDVIVKTKYLDSKLEVKELYGEENDFGYRTSYIQKNKGIVLESTLKLKKGNKEEISNYMNELRNKRNEKQPTEMPSAGSVFRRPEGYYAGKLIQDAGLKGFSIGGAQVSNKHSGFIVNNGSATSKDILNLISHIQQVVKTKFGVELVTEVKVIKD